MEGMERGRAEDIMIRIARFFQSLSGKIISMSIGGMVALAVALGTVTVWKLSGLTEQYEIENVGRIVSQNAEQFNFMLKRSEFAVTHATNMLYRMVDSPAAIEDPATLTQLEHHVATAFEDAVGELAPVASYYVYYLDEGAGKAGSLCYTRDARTGAFRRSWHKTPTGDEVNVPAYRDQVDEVVASGEARWSEPYYSANQHRYLITYTVPLFSDGKVVAIGGIDLNFLDLIRQVDAIHFFETGRAVLVDPSGTRFYTEGTPLGAPSTDYGYQPVGNADAESAERHGHVIRYAHNAEKYDAVCAPLRNGIRVMGIAPQGELYARMQKIILQFLALFVLVEIPFFILSAMLGRHINHRIAGLVRAADSIAAGDYHVVIEDDHEDGLGRLAQAFNIMTERVRGALDQMRHMARYDALTGILNRAGLDAALQEWQRDCANERAALISLDIDGFKFINDLYGHAAGDETLRALARDLTACFPGRHIVGRNGGDEFTVLLVDVSEAQAEEMIRSLHLRKKRFTYEGAAHDYTISIGYAYHPGHGLTMTRLFHQADMALYAVKMEGKNHFLRYHEAMEDMDRSSLGFNLRDVTEQIPNALLACSADEKTRILYANSEMLRLAECGTPEELMEFTQGRALNLIHPADRDAIGRELFAQAAAGKKKSLRYRIQGRKGTIHSVCDIRKAVTSHAYGKVAYVCLVETDLCDPV